MKHIFIIGELAKLNIKKDSSLLLAHSLKELGALVYIVEERDFYITPGTGELCLIARLFTSHLYANEFYMESFVLEKSEVIELDHETTIHMRSDPPVDQRYTRYLWMLDYLTHKEIKVTNHPRGILMSNEKLIPYAFDVKTVPSYYGEDSEGLDHFLKSLKVEDIIVKPIDSFSGIGVEKISLKNHSRARVREMIAKRSEAVIVQPFMSEVLQGEARAIYLGGTLLGAIMKYPQNGSFLANIAQGAKFEQMTLTDSLIKSCELLSKELLNIGIDFVAFDLLGDRVTEVNVTCPGLVNEVSTALGENLGLKYAEYFI